MKIKVHIPTNALQYYVQSIMIFGLATDKEVAMPVNPFPPVPQHSLFFYLHDPIETLAQNSKDFLVRPPALIVGPQLTRVDIKMGHDHLMVHIGFKPGGLHRLTNVPMQLLLDQSYAAADLLGKEADGILDQLRNTADWKQMIAIVEKFLLKRLERYQQVEPIDRAISFLISQKGNMPIEEVAALACLSSRQLERKCKEQIGIPPKLFARLIRFSTAYRLRETNPQMNWSSICYECGYFDQMHLIKDFKAFTGVTPKIIANDLNQTPYRLQANIQL